MTAKITWTGHELYGTTRISKKTMTNVIKRFSSLPKFFL